MQTYFREEHLDLDRVNALAKEESSLNQVDLLTQQEEMMENMENRLKLNLVKAITEFVENSKTRNRLQTMTMTIKRQLLRRCQPLLTQLLPMINSFKF